MVAGFPHTQVAFAGRKGRWHDAPRAPKCRPLNTEAQLSQELTEPCWAEVRYLCGA